MFLKAIIFPLFIVWIVFVELPYMFCEGFVVYTFVVTWCFVFVICIYITVGPFEYYLSSLYYILLRHLTVSGIRNLLWSEVSVICDIFLFVFSVFLLKNLPISRMNIFHVFYMVSQKVNFVFTFLLYKVLSKNYSLSYHFPHTLCYTENYFNLIFTYVWVRVWLMKSSISFAFHRHEVSPPTIWINWKTWCRHSIAVRIWAGWGKTNSTEEQFSSCQTQEKFFFFGGVRISLGSLK